MIDRLLMKTLPSMAISGMTFLILNSMIDSMIQPFPEMTAAKTILSLNSVIGIIKMIPIAAAFITGLISFFKF